MSDAVDVALPLLFAAENLSQYAQRFPKLKGSGNSYTDCERKSDRVLAMQLVQALTADVSLATPMYKWLLGRQQQQEKNQAAGERWHPTYCYLEKLSKDWCAEWLTKHAAQVDQKTTLNLALMNRIDAHDIRNVKKLMHFLTMTTPMTKLPRAALDKQVCALMLSKRAGKVGALRLQVLAAGVNAAGVVDFAVCGAYKLSFRDGKATEIVHQPSGVKTEVPGHVYIDDTFELLDNEFDMSATVKKGAASYKLAELFKKDGPPWTWMLDKKGLILNDLAVEAEKEQGEKRKRIEATNVTGDAANLRDAATERKQQAVAKARAKRAANPSVKRRKTVARLSA